MSKRGTAILDEPEQGYGSSPDRSSPPRRSSSRAGTKLRRNFSDDFADEYDTDARSGDRQTGGQPRQPGLRLRLRARVPRSIAGRIATGLALLMIAGAGFGLLMVTRTFLLHDERFMIQSASSIEIQGNEHLTRAQLLDIFDEDIGRNIFRISLDEKQADLEALPWVQHATIMRLLPGRIRLSIVERKPIAFVRQGAHIGLVDADGVLLDMARDGAGSSTEPHYSFPVITGISPNDPASTRAARMRIFQRFTSDMDSSGEKISENLSEVDLSNPEDVKALIPDHSAEILVHFGDDHFLDRYRRFQELLPQWRTQYPNLASVDMRYEREVVLDMAGSTAAKAEAAPGGPSPTVASNQVAAKPVPQSEHTAATRKIASTPTRLPVKTPVQRNVKPQPKAAVLRPSKPVATKPAPKPTQKPVAGSPVSSAGSPGSTVSKPESSNLSASAAARSGFPSKTPNGKPAAGKPVLSPDTYHPPQVAPR